MIIVTQEIIDKEINIDHDAIANIKDIRILKKKLLEIDLSEEIKIYDLGIVKSSSNKICEVRDHVNKTGKNPIIGNKKIEFKDISKLYGSKNGITTTCCGKDLNLNHENPSHYLCFYAILIFYLGFTNIKGFIINYEK
tara:strand:- start:559 stop:972 length:414 start_codon:yes stop_codon:yes gene_type:complete